MHREESARDGTRARFEGIRRRARGSRRRRPRRGGGRRAWLRGPGDVLSRRRGGPCPGRRRGRPRGIDPRSDRRVDQRRDDDGVLARRRRRARRLPPRDRGDVPRSGVGHHGRTRADARSRPRCDRERRLRARVHRHPVAERVLRIEVRMPRLLRIGARRAAARTEQRPDQHGPPSGGEHPAVRLVQEHHRPTGHAGAARVPAGARGAVDRGCGARRAAGEGSRLLEQPAGVRGGTFAHAGEPLRRHRRLGCPTQRRADDLRRPGEPAYTGRPGPRLRRPRSLRRASRWFPRSPLPPFAPAHGAHVPGRAACRGGRQDRALRGRPRSGVPHCRPQHR